MTASALDARLAAGGVFPRSCWRSRGYGWILNVGADAFSILDVLGGACREADGGPVSRFLEAFDVVEGEEPELLRLRHRGDVTVYAFDRLAAAPPVTSGNTDPVRSFEAFWGYLDQNYAFFDLCETPVETLKADSRRLLGPDPTAQTLHEAVSSVIGALGDAHAMIDTGEGVIDVGSPIRERKAALQQRFGVPPWSQDRLSYTRTLQACFGEMFLGGRFESDPNRMMIYGEIAPGVGYMTLFGEFGHAETDGARAALDLPRPRLDAAAFLQDERAALERHMQPVVERFASMKAVIVDARLNYGGYDRLALDFAGHFTDAPRTTFWKKAWTPNGFTQSQPIDIAPRRPSLAHVPVFLLTSRQTASAGEILVMAMKACPNVRTIGEPTLGILSDNLYKRLPNGWELSLSNEVYLAPDGALHERKGIPPDTPCPVFDPADIPAGLRVAVETALAEAAALTPSR